MSDTSTTATQTADGQDIPRIAISPDSAREVTPEAIEKFRTLYKTVWPAEFRKVIEAKKITFMLGDFNNEVQPVDSQNRTVKINAELLDRTYGVTVAPYQGFLCACLPEIPPIDAQALINEYGLNVTPPSWQHDMATILASASYNMNKGIGESAFREAYPNTYEVIMQLNRARRKIAKEDYSAIGAQFPASNTSTDLNAAPLARNRPTDRIEARRQRIRERLAASATPPSGPPLEDTPKPQVDLHLQEIEAERKRLETAIALTPFSFSGYAQSVLDRGNSNAPLPIRPNERAARLRLQDVARREVIPVKEALNKNFEPHNALGEALFLEDNYQVMRIAENINTGARPQWSNEQGRAHAAEQIERIFSLELDESPVHQANQDRQQQLIDALSNAPILLIAAVGSLNQVRKAQDLQQQLFPERKSKLDEAGRADLIQQRSLLAVEALEQAGIEVPPVIIEKIVPASKPNVDEPAADTQQGASQTNEGTQDTGNGSGGRPPRRPALPSGFSPDGDDPDDRIPSKPPLTAYDIGQIIDAHVSQREPGQFVEA